jgi:photosystem II stability/assembly factor-like uncharacterized protein
MRAALVLVVLLFGAAGCGGGSGGGSGDTASPDVAWVDPDGDAPYIGSLSVNPSDGSLLMASNTGLFKIPAKGGTPAKITGELTTPNGSGNVSEALVARFVGPDELVGSGHPRPGGTTLPQSLGLIHSGDAGRTWESVSQLGTADFHAISANGETVVAPLFGQGQIQLSRDGGRNFESRVAPMALVDLAVDPGNPRRWVATSEQGIYVTLDEGKTWRQRDNTPNVRLAWQDPLTLYRIDPGGAVKISGDGGDSWQARGDTGGEPQALAVDGDGVLYAASLDGVVKRSQDGGKTWAALVTP